MPMLHTQGTLGSNLDKRQVTVTGYKQFSPVPSAKW